MGDNRSKCKRNNGGIEAMEALRMESTKRRRIASPRLQLNSPPSHLQCDRRSLLNSLENSTCPDDLGEISPRSCSDRVSPFKSSRNDSSELMKCRSLRSVHTETESFETEKISVFIDDGHSRGTIPTSQLWTGDSERLDSPAKPRKRTGSTEAKMPAGAEIEEFFAVAEKYEAKRFAEKYNYDIAKDAAMEGRYEWVQLNPSSEGEMIK